MKKLISLIFIFLIIPFVSAEGRGEITHVSSDTLRMSWDSSIRQVNYVSDNIVWSYDGMPVSMYETDREIGLVVYAQNRNFHRLTIVGDGVVGRLIVNKKYPIILCSLNAIPSYARKLTRSRFCENYDYAYNLRSLKIGQSLNFRIPQLRERCVDDFCYETNAWSIWVGNGASTGGGLPVCSGLATSINRNETTTPYLSKFRMGSYAGFSGSSTAGCIATQLTWQEWNGGSYQIIPTTSTLPLNADGVAMSQPDPAFGSWYYRYPQCILSAGSTVNIRIKFDGTYLSRPQTVYSNVLTQTCEAEIIPEPEVNITRPTDNFVIEEIILKDKKKNSYWLVLGTLPLIIILTRKKRRKE